MLSPMFQIPYDAALFHDITEIDSHFLAAAAQYEYRKRHGVVAAVLSLYYLLQKTLSDTGKFWDRFKRFRLIV